MFSRRIPLLSFICVSLVSFSAAVAVAQVKPQRATSNRPRRAADAKNIDLPSSKMLAAPAPGAPQRLNGMSANLAVSPDGRYVAIVNAGYGTRESNYAESIALLDRTQNTVVDFPDTRFGKDAKQTLFYGIAFSADGQHVYACVGSITDPEGKQAGNLGNGIAVYAVNNGSLQPERFLKLAPQPIPQGRRRAHALKNAPEGTAPAFPAGIAVVRGSDSERLLVANNDSDNAVLLDAASGKVIHSFDLGEGNAVPATYPYGVAVSRDGKRGWVSLWNASAVAELDLTSGQVVRRVPLRPPDAPAAAASSHPTALLLSNDEKRLYCTLATRDQVAVIPAGGGSVSYISTQLPGQQYDGSYPVAVAQSVDGKRLYVADASADAVAVIDATATTVLGFVPTEWYPTSLAVVGDELIVATAKGKGTGPNAGTPLTPTTSVRKGAYILSLIAGSVARIKLADVDAQLPLFTREVLEANRMSGRLPQFAFAGGKSPIHHVIYIIKENRTYDQVFGDIKEANGDPSLVMYGDEITPNEHKLVRQFGVLDNFYDSGEVSGDGHVWSNAAIASDYTERVVPLNYRGKERTYDFEGSVAEENPLKQGIADVDDPGTGYLWGNAARHGMSWRDYGEFVKVEFCTSQTEVSPHQRDEQVAACRRKFIAKGDPLPEGFGDPPGSASPYPWHIPLTALSEATKPEIEGHFDPKFTVFNTSYPDQLRMDEFLREFKQFVAARQSGRGEPLPSLVVMHLPNDHTAGTRAAGPSPEALVADNDLALGRLVEAVSHSPYWDDTAILVLEDDAQNGVDHVDAHRSTALVISKYSPIAPGKPFVDSRFYTTVNMVHTIEALLGLPPMNNNDARAAIMAPLFSGPGTQAPFTADWRNKENGMLYRTNPQNAPGAGASAKMDFSRPDAADAQALNRILWHAAKGNVPMPAPKHSVIPQ